MSKYESALINKANKRLERMYTYLEGSHESIDRVEFGIGIITGQNNVGVPKLHLRGLNPEQKTQMIELAKSYLGDPYSTKKGTIAMLNMGFNKVVSDPKRNITNHDDVVALARLFDDNRWKRLQEIERTASEQVIEMVQLGVEKQMTPKAISNAILNWIKVASEYNGSFYEYMDEQIKGTNKKKETED